MINNEVTKVFQLVIFLFLVTFIAIGCGSSGGGGGDDDDDQSLTITGESGNQVNLNGTWESGCIADMDDGESEIVLATISGSTFSQNVNQWVDSTTCSGASDMTWIFSGTFVLGNEVTATEDGSDVTATVMDLVFTSVEGTINNPDLVADANTQKECDADDWEVDTPKELLGTSCMPDADDKDLIYIDDTADPDVLYGGDDDGPLDVNGYPTVIESDTSQERL
jgi:hypothetical protein